VNRVARRSGTVRLAVAVVALGAALPTGAEVHAQTGGCEVFGSSAVPSGLLADGCRKASDVFRFLAPQVGVAVSGGNVLPGEGGALGGWGKRSAVLRVTGVVGAIPANAVSLSNGEVSSDFGAARAPIPVPSLDVAVGLLRGVPVGLTNLGGVDLLVSVTAVPRLAREDVSLNNEGRAITGSIGARVGLLQESVLVPGVALSVMRRGLPSTSLTYRTGNDTLGVFGTRVRSTVSRLTVNKRFGLFALGGGFGQDRFDTRTTLEAVINQVAVPPGTVPGEGPEPIRAVARIANLRDETTRNTAFVHVGLGLARAQLVLELGRSQAGEARELLNRFGDRRANEAYRFGSLGFGIRF